MGKKKAYARDSDKSEMSLEILIKVNGSTEVKETYNKDSDKTPRAGEFYAKEWD